MVNIYIEYKINLWPFPVGNDFTLENSLFEAIKLTKNITDFDKYKYFGFGTGFDARRSFLLSDVNRFGKNVIIFGSNTSSSVHVDYRNKDTLVLGKIPKKGSGDTILTTEKEFAINFRKQQEKTLHYNGVNSYLFVNGVENYKFKANNSEINVVLFCLGNASKDFLADNMKAD